MQQFLLLLVWCEAADGLLDKLEVQQEALEMQQLQMQVHIAALPVDEKRDEEQKKQAGRIRKSFLFHIRLMKNLIVT